MKRTTKTCRRFPVGDCDNCGRPMGTGSARGLCARCYQHRRRHGGLPPRTPLITRDKTAALVVRVDRRLHRQISLTAKRVGLSTSEWVRQTCAARMGAR